MKKQEIIFSERSFKKHSVRYDTLDDGAAIKTIYVRKEALGPPFPDAIKITIEEVE